MEFVSETWEWEYTKSLNWSYILKCLIETCHHVISFSSYLNISLKDHDRTQGKKICEKDCW